MIEIRDKYYDPMTEFVGAMLSLIDTLRENRTPEGPGSDATLKQLPQYKRLDAAARNVIFGPFSQRVSLSDHLDEIIRVLHAGHFMPWRTLCFDALSSDGIGGLTSAVEQRFETDPNPKYPHVSYHLLAHGPIDDYLKSRE